jgi:hypothetical protein
MRATSTAHTWLLFRAGRLGFALAVGAALSPATAAAVEIDLLDGEVAGSFDTTLTSGVLIRAADRDKNLVGVANGGTAYSVNGDDGNLNYDQGDPTSAQIRANHELQLGWRNFSTFWRAYYFYDPVIKSVATRRTALNEAAKDRAGLRFKLLDAYAAADLDVLDMPLTVRVGNQVISWGESTFIQNGINVINPFDVTLLRVPGAELRNALLPIPALDVSLAITDRISVEGFYQFLWEATDLEPRGTYFSTTDIASPGSKFAILGFGSIGDDPIPPPEPGLPVGNAIPRGDDNNADDEGQGGIAIRYFEPQLWGTEFGFYYIRYNSRLPLLSALTGTRRGAFERDYASTSRYFREYPNGIDLFAGSFSSEIGTTGVAVQGELSYRLGQPLQVDDVELLFAGLTPVPLVGDLVKSNQLGVFGFEEYIRGWRRKDVLQPQVTVTKLFGPTLGADQLLLLGEIGATLVMGMEDKATLRYEGPGTYTSGDPFFTDIGIQPETQKGGFADKRSWGYRLIVRPTYNRAIGAINLEPLVAFQHDVQGTTPLPIGNFVEDRKAITLSLRGVYLESISAELAYNAFFDGGRFNLIKDRDFVSLSFSYAF